MIIESRYTKVFSSDGLTRLKYNELYGFAVYLRDFKNEVSKEINDNLFKYIELNTFSFLKEMREKHKNVIPSSFDKQLYEQVLTCYQNRFETIQKRISFECIDFKGFEYYKRNCKAHRKGDVKKLILKRRKSPLSICLSYLSRYGNENIAQYIDSQLNTIDNKKREYYLNILRCIEKFGLERLLKLALSKKERVLSKYSEKPVEFKSLTFSGRCRKKDIISYNKNYNSIINSFISLSGLNRKSFDIPVKFNKDWFGNMRDFHKDNPDYEYVITFNEKHKRVNVNICKEGERYIPEVNENSKSVGIDVNVKHNLFCLSDGTSYDYDRELVNDFSKLSMYLDSVKGKEGTNWQPGKRYSRKLLKMREKMVKSEQELISGMCKALKNNGVSHIIMEDLEGRFGKSFVKDKANSEMNFNRTIKFLKISNLKNEVEHIARKYGIAVSSVQPFYTSKMCPICGCIEDENRMSQEHFRCIECGHSENADINAAKNIKNRVSEAVLRNKLLKQIDNGAFRPKSLEKDKVKEVLLSFRRNLSMKGSESRYIQYEYI